MTATDAIFVGLLLIVLIPVTLTDLNERRIPNWANLALAALGFAHAMAGSFTWHRALLALLTFTLAGLTFSGTAWIVGRINRAARIGWGDLKFLTAASLWVGIDGSIAVLFVASVIALLVALASAPWKPESWRQPQPFGPMLAAGMLTVVALVFTFADRS